MPEAVIKWWLFLAVKLKQPGGNALFDNYLEQLTPDSAEQVSMWVLDSWVNYDTARPREEDGNAHAKAGAQSHFDYLKRWYKGYTLEQAFEDLKRHFMSNYLNTGAATKGLLGLAKHANSAVAADRVRNYLKNHGSRTSQSSALLEMLAGIGDSVALQGDHFRRDTTQAERRAAIRGHASLNRSPRKRTGRWTNWAIGPSPAPDSTRRACSELPCGPDSKLYTARLDESLLLAIRNPDGKVGQGAASGPDDTTKASKKSLSASRKELKQVVAMQSARLYESLCSGRKWSQQDWSEDLYSHPVMRKLVERVVWAGFDESGELVTTFRPTAEGDFTSASDDDVEIDALESIGIAYGAEMDPASGEAWAEHLKDYEVKPLFTQFGRSLLSLPDDIGDKTKIEDRKGWVTDTFTSAATRRSWVTNAARRWTVAISMSTRKASAARASPPSSNSPATACRRRTWRPR